MTTRSEAAAEQRTAIVEGIRQGLRLDSAAKAAGVPASTARAWLQRGQESRDKEEADGSIEAADRVLADFADAFETAEAVFEVDLVTEVRDGGPTWAKAAWLLERRFPERWSSRVRETVERERQEMLTSLRGRLDEVTFRRVSRALSDHLLSTKKPGVGGGRR